MFAVIFALLKFFGANTEDEFHLQVARGFFVALHLFFIIVFLKARNTIVTMMATQDVKLEEGDLLKSVSKGMIIKAFLIAAVHYKTNMIQPLVMSSVMGFMALLESRITHNEVASLLPFLFEREDNKKKD